MVGLLLCHPNMWTASIHLRLNMPFTSHSWYYSPTTTFSVRRLGWPFSNSVSHISESTIIVYQISEEIRTEKSTTVKYINVQCMLLLSTLYNAQPLPNLFDTGSFFCIAVGLLAPKSESGNTSERAVYYLSTKGVTQCHYLHFLVGEFISVG
jgi:hypothetical protein